MLNKYAQSAEPLRHAMLVSLFRCSLAAIRCCYAVLLQTIHAVAAIFSAAAMLISLCC